MPFGVLSLRLRKKNTQSYYRISISTKASPPGTASEDSCGDGAESSSLACTRNVPFGGGIRGGGGFPPEPLLSMG